MSALIFTYDETLDYLGLCASFIPSWDCATDLGLEIRTARYSESESELLALVESTSARSVLTILAQLGGRIGWYAKDRLDNEEIS